MLNLRVIPLLLPTLAWVLGLAAARVDGVSWQLDLLLLGVLSILVGEGI